MAKSLLEKANNQVWDALFREVVDYPNTTLRVMNNLKSINWISDLKFEDVHWIVKEVLHKTYFNYGDIYDLFHREQNK
jgi:hypothetical protein